MDKPIIRQSHIQNYLICKRSYQLSLEYDIQQTKSMDTGKIFEFMTFGFKSDEDKKELIYTPDKKLKDKKNKDGTITQGKIKQGKLKADFINLKSIAENVRKTYFGKGKAHQRFEVDMGDFILTGELDWEGEVIANGIKLDDCDADLKYCADVPKVWDWKQKKSDFFQSVSYPYIRYKLTGKVRTFYYVVVDKSGNVRVIKINYDYKKVFAWYETIANMAFYDKICEPNYDSCKGTGKFDPRCKYLNDCMFGKEYVFGYQEIDFESLVDEIDIEIIENEQKKFTESTKKKSKMFDPKMDVDEEVKESDLDELINKSKFEMFTACEDQIKDGLLYCRGCNSKQKIEKGEKSCPNCNTKIMWI